MAVVRYARPGEQVTGLPVGVSNDFLSLPIPGAHFNVGDAVPTITPTYGVRASGLVVPQKYTRSPVPLDSIATYLTGRDVFGFMIPAEVTVDHLTRLPLLAVLHTCARLLRLIDRPGSSQADADATLLADFTPSARRQIAAMLSTGQRVLVAPHVLLELMKNAARFSGDCLLPDVTPGVFACAMVGTGDDLGVQADALDDSAEDDLVVGAGVPGRLEREFVAIHHFHRQIDPAHVVARFIRRWTQLPAELHAQPRVVDLPTEFRAAVGVGLDDFIAAGVLLHSTAIGSGPWLSRDALLEEMELEEGAAERILGLVARTPADLRAWARDSSSTPMWEFSYLERFPVLDCGDQLLILRPDLVLQRFFGWLPLFDIEAGLGTSTRARKRLSQIKGCVEHLGEVYALETLRVQAHRHHLRLFEETELRTALSPQSGQTSDVTVDDGRRWAVFEVTSSRLTRPSVANTSGERLDEDFGKLLEKVGQLDDTITRLQMRETALTGQPVPSPRRRYFPVLVLTEGFPVNPITLTILRSRAEKAGLLHGDDVAELEVVDGVELEMLEGAAFGEATVLDALEAKEKASLYRDNLRAFLLREHHFKTRTPDRVSQLAQLAYDVAVQTVRYPPTTDAA